MNRCKKIKSFISDYIENSIVGDHKKDIELHIKNCKGCSDTIDRVVVLKNRLLKLKPIQTSSDFETVLRTRIKIESGLGRRRLNEIFLPWTARIPLYGMSLALIIIAALLILEQVNKSQMHKPDAAINSEWYGGNPGNNSSPSLISESENVIYVLDEMSPEEFLNKKGTLLNSDSNSDSKEGASSDSTKRNNQLEQVHHVTF